LTSCTARASDGSVNDFAGLLKTLDYVAEVGVTTLWLLPFYWSARSDDGYDLDDYRGVHPNYGTLADARRFVKEVHKRWLTVMTEVVMNHTSDQHPWSQHARRTKPGS
jgi:maltose alpha-D-glucosyltransferase/alpha-amylase